MDILRTHPMVIIGGILRENQFFVPPHEMLRELRRRKSAEDRRRADPVLINANQGEKHR
jgi:hypothetical protein